MSASQSRRSAEQRRLAAFRRVALLLRREGGSRARLLRDLAAALRGGMEDPRTAAVRIRLGPRVGAKRNVAARPHRLRKEFRTADGQRGAVEAVYAGKGQASGRRFSAEERLLVEAAAEMLAAHLGRQTALDDLGRVRESLEHGEERYRALAEEALHRARDELEERVAERTAQLRKANKALRMISECDEALVHAASESELLQHMCRIIVDVGGYRLAWVGYADHDEARSVRPVTQAGFEAGYLERVKITWADEPHGRGPTGTAIRTGRPSVARRILTDPRLAPWRKEAVRRQYASSVGLPLVADARTLGALSIYAAEPDAFDAEEVRLLMELADDLAYGVVALRTRAERQRAEEDLRETNELLEQMFASIHVLIAYMDKDFNFIRVNPAYAEADGREPESFVGQNHFALYPNEENEVIFRRVVETGEPFSVHERPFEYAAHLERGVTYWDWKLQPVRDAQGRVSGVVLSLLDVTDRRRARERIEAERRRLFSVLNMLPGFVFLQREDYSIAFANHRFLDLFGDPAGRPCWAVVRGRDGVCEPCHGDEVLASGGPREWEVAGLAGRDYHVWGYPFWDSDGTKFVLQLGIDVTERRELEREILDISDAEQRRIGHDLHDVLGQHLTGIALVSKALARRLSDAASPDAAQAADIAALVNQAVAQVRAISRGLCPVEVTEEGLMAALKDMAAGVEKVFGIPCLLQCVDPILIYESAVATHLYHIAQEAVNNAVKHARPRRVSLTLAEEDGDVVLSVRDDGVGLPDDADRGKGMGLRIMRYRADMIGASLEVKRGPEGGTVVVCRVPADVVQGRR